MIVLVPAYEPDGRLVALVRGLRDADPALRVLVVDDGSGPAHASVFAAVAALGATVLAHPGNRGKGAALKTGFAHAAATWPGDDVVCADCDGQHRVADVLRVAARVRAGEPLVLGARRFPGDVPLRSRVGNGVTRVLFRVATGRALHDTQTGLRGYAAALLPELGAVPGDRFEYELTVLLRAARRGDPIGEAEIATVYLEGNASSHFRPVADSVRVYAPLLGFLLSSFAAFLVDTVALLVLAPLTGSLVAAVAGARLLSATGNFCVNRALFTGSGGRAPLGRSAARYAALAVTLLAGNYALLAVLTGAGLPLLPAKVTTEALLVAASYAVQRSLVFRRRAAARRVPAVPPPRELVSR